MRKTLTDQVVEKVRQQILSGEFAAGDRLPSIRDLAQQHGVSEITVRGVLRQLREAGLVAIKPRAGAVVCGLTADDLSSPPMALSSKKTVAMVLPSLSDPFFARIAHGAERECTRKGLRFLIVTTGGNIEAEVREIVALSGQVAGLMVFPIGVRESAPYAFCRKRGVPFVFIDRGVEGVAAPVIRTDNEQAGYLAGQHLLSLKRPIWLLSDALGWLTPVDDRVRGFRRALADEGVPFEASRVLQARGGEEMVGATLMRRLMAFPQAKKPFSVLTLNEMIARGAYAVVKELGGDIPGHISVVTFGDTLSPLLEPQISGVWLGEENWGRDAAALLFTGLKGDKMVQPAPIVPQFILRGSCGTNKDFCRVTSLLEHANSAFSASYITPLSA